MKDLSSWRIVHGDTLVNMLISCTIKNVLNLVFCIWAKRHEGVIMVTHWLTCLSHIPLRMIWVFTLCSQKSKFKFEHVQHVSTWLSIIWDMLKKLKPMYTFLHEQMSLITDINLPLLLFDLVMAKNIHVILMSQCLKRSGFGHIKWLQPIDFTRFKYLS